MKGQVAIYVNILAAVNDVKEGTRNAIRDLDRMVNHGTPHQQPKPHPDPPGGPIGEREFSLKIQN